MKTLLIALLFSAFAFAQTQEMNISYGEHPQQEYDIYNARSNWNNHNIKLC